MTLIDTSRQSEKATVYIFGAGTAGKHALKNLAEDFTVKGFIDNAIEKQGTQWQGLPVYSPEILAKVPECKVYIASEFFEQIQRQLCIELDLAPSVFQPLPARLLAGERFEHNLEHADTALNLLSACCQFLQKLNVMHHVDAGTLLGLFRDKSLIPWDDDLDIAFNSADIGCVIEKVHYLTEQLDDISNESWQIQTHYSQHAFGNVPKGAVRSLKLVCTTNACLPAIDFFVKYVNEEFSDYCLASRGIRMPAAYSSQTKTYTCVNREWQIPHRTEEYLAHHYGDWQTPNPNWSLQELKNTEVFEG